MKLLTITNLYPRPDQPTRGMYNKQLFDAIAKQLQLPVNSYLLTDGEKENSNNQEQITNNSMTNLVIVPECRVWRWPEIRGWTEPHSGLRSQPSALSVVYCPVFYLPIIGRNFSVWFYEKSLAACRLPLATFLKECDVILASWLYPDGVAAVNLAKKHQKPVWIQVLGSDRFHLKTQVRKKQILEACNYARGILPNCQFLADELIKAGVSKEKIHVVPNGVDGELFKYRSKKTALEQLTSRQADKSTERSASKEEAKNQLMVNGYSLLRDVFQEGRNTNNQFPITNNCTKYILFIANLVPVKQPEVMIRAFHALVTGYRGRVTGYRLQSYKFPPKADSTVAETSGQEDEQKPNSLQPIAYSLLIIGDGKLRKKLERQAKKLGISELVHFLGARPHEEIALWMNAADCLCLCSKSEGMPNVVLEALASGLPVVATDVGACRDMLKDEPCSRIVGMDKSVGYEAIGCRFSKDMAEMLNMKIDREAMAERYGGKYSWNRTAEQIVQAIP